MSYRLEAEFTFYKTGPSDADLNDFLDRVDDHLVVKLGAQDVLIVSDESTSKFVISMAVQGDGEANAFSNALGTLRAALHAEDCETPEWPTWAQFVRAGISGAVAREEAKDRLVDA